MHAEKGCPVLAQLGDHAGLAGVDDRQRGARPDKRWDYDGARAVKRAHRSRHRLANESIIIIVAAAAEYRVARGPVDWGAWLLRFYGLSRFQRASSAASVN